MDVAGGCFGEDSSVSDSIAMDGVGIGGSSGE